jgi:site-specific recombinase XerD
MNENTALEPIEGTFTVVAAETDSDKLIRAWLKSKRSPGTRRVYARYAYGLLDHTGKSLYAMTMNDVSSYVDTLKGSDATLALANNALKSLFTYATQLGYITVNLGKGLTAPKPSDDLAQRIVPEADMIRIVNGETNPRNHAMLRLMYHAGLRVSEIVALTWDHIRLNGSGAVLDIVGKGGKMRHVPITKSMYDELRTLAGPDSDRFVFQSRKNKSGLPLLTRQVGKIVEEAAIRANVAIYYDETGKKRSHFSPHWERHAHVSHSIDNGEDITVVGTSVGHTSLNTTMRYRHLNPEIGSSRHIKV